MSQLSEQLKPYRERFASRTQERDVLRISGVLGKAGWTEEKNRAMSEILKWVKKRVQTDIPAHAWDGKSFEVRLGGRNTECISFSIDGSEVWGIRTEVPDKNKAGRIWATEIILVKTPSNQLQIGLRLLVSSEFMDNDFDPTVPGFVQQIIETVGIHSPTNDFFATKRDINDKNSYMEFEEHLLNPKRQTPLIVISGNSKAKNYAIDPKELAKDLVGITHVYCLDSNWALSLSKKVGKTLSVFNGGARVYMPGFDESANPGAHPLATKVSLQVPERNKFIKREIQRLIAQDSIRRNRLGREVVSYSSVNSLKLEKETKKLETDAAKLETETKKLKIKSQKDSELEQSLRNQIISLEKDVVRSDDQMNQSLDLAAQNEERAKNAEEDKNGLIARLQTLEDALKKSDIKVPQSKYPDSWKKVAAWVQENLSSHLELTASAKKGLKNNQYESIKKVCECLEWLASDYRQARIYGGDAAKPDFKLREDILNSPCGGDEYDFEHEGQNHKADLHIKNGGNTRDPKRCLRIYYKWDETSNRIIFSDLPAHRKTSMS